LYALLGGMHLATKRLASEMVQFAFLDALGGIWVFLEFI